MSDIITHTNYKVPDDNDADVKLLICNLLCLCSFIIYILFFFLTSLLNKVMWDYRSEKWSKLLTSILETSLKCAYLTAKVPEYVSNCMELIGRCILFYNLLDLICLYHGVLRHSDKVYEGSFSIGGLSGFCRQ